MLDVENGQITADSEMFAKTLIFAYLRNSLPLEFKVIANIESTHFMIAI